MKFNIKKLLFYIIITFVIGNLFSFLVMDTSFYEKLNKGIEVPPLVFPIVWSILFLMMGIGSYVISNSSDEDKKSALRIYFIQLFVNSLWTLIFFGFRLYTVAFVWILLLIFLVVVMIIKFYRINKMAGLIQIPYLLWLIFAGYLTITIVILN